MKRLLLALLVMALLTVVTAPVLASQLIPVGTTKSSRP